MTGNPGGRSGLCWGGGKGMPPIPWPDIAPRNEGSGLGMLANVVIGVMRFGGLPGLG